ncbi:DEAD/DEAH box helicase family protein [Burkholderia gladioli]|uniref:DEAD/DEAH box helicase family protein n=1 Tax=Burkholderia gladioli TaxID=28095 RepID=UPI003B986950
MANPILLRPYQLDSVEALREGMRAGHRAQVLMAPTGAGKTEIGAYLCDEVNKKGRRAAFVVDRVNLVTRRASDSTITAFLTASSRRITGAAAVTSESRFARRRRSRSAASFPTWIC